MINFNSDFILSNEAYHTIQSNSFLIDNYLNTLSSMVCKIQVPKMITFSVRDFMNECAQLLQFPLFLKSARSTKYHYVLPIYLNR